MKNDILNYIDKGRFEEIVEYIINDQNLNHKEKLILIILFNQAKESFPKKKIIAEKSSLSINEINKTLKSLVQNNWCTEDILKNPSNKIASYLKLAKIKDKDQTLCKQKGSEIAKKWTDIFGTQQLTPVNLEKFISFIDDGIQEEVIIEVMKLSSENAEGNPVNYALNVLHNFLKRNILTWEDFQEERGEREEYERQIQKNNRAKEKRKKLHDIKELEEKGWN